ncbi:MAG TPA: M28 family peptidase [Terriglobales bacterium]|nr:M28 family peptidase [Terriglobales bacterium]
MTAAAAEPAPAPTVEAPKVNGAKAMEYVRQVVAFGPRPIGSEGHKKLQAYIREHLKNDDLEEDKFSAETPDGKFDMINFIAKFPGTKDGVVVIAGHYDTKIMKGFVGANDGGSSTGLPLELANVLREHKEGRPTVWIVLLDGEEAVKQWTDTDSTYGSRHLAQKWQQEGVLPKIKAFLLLDMVGDADLDIQRDTNSTSWLEDMIQEAAAKQGYGSNFFAMETPIEDDHIPFVRLGVPSADLIDLDYGPNNSYWHTTKDTLDKLSPKSLEVVGNTVLKVVWNLK